jgi:hypothetical protein
MTSPFHRQGFIPIYNVCAAGKYSEGACIVRFFPLFLSGAETGLRLSCETALILHRDKAATTSAKIIGIRGKETISQSMDASMNREKSFAVVLDFGGCTRVVSGPGTFEVDRDLGPVLKVRLQPDDGSCEAGCQTLMLQEGDLRGRTVPDDRYGCDFRVDFYAMANAV